MTNLQHLCLSLAVLASASARADVLQTATAGGATLDAPVVSITLAAPMAGLTLADGTTLQAPMESVAIHLDYSGVNSITTAAAKKPAHEGRIYNVSGQRVNGHADRLNKGLYIIDGRKQIRK